MSTENDAPAGDDHGDDNIARELRPVSRFFLWFAGILAVGILGILLPSWSGVKPVLSEFWSQGACKVYLAVVAVLWLARLVIRPRDTFYFHGLHAFAAMTTLGILIATAVPLEIKKIGTSFLIFFWHFPQAINCFVFFTLLMIFGILVLATDNPIWDRAARVSGQIGLLCCTVLLTTGSTWARCAWGQWWVWDDPRLMTAAVMFLTYVGYVVMQVQLEDPYKRRRYSAVFGIMAFINLPLVHYSIQWFGETAHPMKFDQIGSDLGITMTRWFGVAAFLILYSLILRWKLQREFLRDHVEEALAEVRRIEEGVRV